MMTPQEVASHAFAKATIGGYNMAMVDEFLDVLTEDYTALYNDNAILKNKLKVLSDTIEEYRATDNAMRKTLLAAQKMADALVAEAEEKKFSLVRDAEALAARRIAELKSEISSEEYRLKTAQEATVAYVQKIRALHSEELALLDGLSSLVPEDAGISETAAQIEDAVASIVQLYPEADAAEPAEEEEVPAQEPAKPVYEELDPSVTRRFEDLQFAKDYEIE